GRLASGLREGRTGLTQLREPAQVADRELQRALKELDGMLATSKLDPAYRRLYEAVGTAAGAVSGRDPRNGERVREGYDGLDAALATAVTRLDEAVAGAEQLRDGLARLGGGLAALDRGVGELRAGIGRLRAGATRLQDGLRRLRSGGGDLEDGLAALRRGAGALDAGTGRLAGGAAQLSGGLGDGAQRSAQLSAGVARISDGVAASDALGDADQLVRVTRSGHMLLAAVDSAPGRERGGAQMVVNLDSGGSAADITVVARHDPSHAGEPLRERLELAARRFSDETGMRAYVGGSAPVFQDFDKVSSERLPLLILGLVVLTYLALVVIFRSLVLPAIAVLLNAATVLAAFGVLALLFQGDDPLLGGPGFLDAISVFGTLSVVFGLSIDYAVFLIARMREGYSLTQTTEGAVTYAINGTARIITGAAAIMSGVFLALAVSDVSNLRQLGVGLAVAVILDATLVRLVLLPALVKLAGPAAWWLPSRLHALWPPALSPAAPGSSGPTSATSS
ncbi:MAG TPA: MMPL family transporter, partial [Solirubrobacteraceae bacterium]